MAEGKGQRAKGKGHKAKGRWQRENEIEDRRSSIFPLCYFVTSFVYPLWLGVPIAA